MAEAATHPRSQTASAPRDLAMVAVFAALIAVLSITAAIPLPVGVPITLQTLGVVLAGLTLGAWRGALANVLYIVVGLVGLPVFAGGTAGVAVLAKPSIGYLLSYPLAAFVAGAMVTVFTKALGRNRQIVSLFLGGLVGLVVIHVGGIIGMSVVLGLSLGAATLADLPFVPGDLIKLVLSVLIARTVHKAFPRLFR